MHSGIITASYLIASVLFIYALSGLRDYQQAKRSIWAGIVGMAIAITATLFLAGIGWAVAAALLIASVIGTIVSRRVKMIEMPQLVAALHSFVGVAAVFIGINSDLLPVAETTPAAKVVHQIELFLGVFIGAITFSGSVVAFGKLAGKLESKALVIPGRHLWNLLAAVVCLSLLLLYVQSDGSWTIYLMTLIALLLGVHLIMAIGGADMPVVVSMLNSYSGWAASMTGFLLGNDLLIITGALVGASGAYLSYIMCKGMNRPFISVILGGAFGGPAAASAEIEGSMTETTAAAVASSLREAESVIIVPGYGMAVSQAQGAVSDLTARLRDQNKKVRFGIHPVAGRLPGHMNVLLAEARVPYDIVHEMDDINDDFSDTDMVIVIGSNDIVNLAALNDEGSPIYGMPILRVWEAKRVVVCKRGQGTGYSGIENPLFYEENTAMLYGDAKNSIEEISIHLRSNTSS